MTDPAIPYRLLIFNPDDWPGPDPTHLMSIPVLIQRERWRQAQDAWGHEHGIWRDRFEELQAQQVAAREGT